MALASLKGYWMDMLKAADDGQQMHWVRPILTRYARTRPSLKVMLGGNKNKRFLYRRVIFGLPKYRGQLLNELKNAQTNEIRSVMEQSTWA